jgi:hypothetical protein
MVLIKKKEEGKRVARNGKWFILPMRTGIVGEEQKVLALALIVIL